MFSIAEQSLAEVGNVALRPNAKELQNPLHTLLLRPGEYDMKIMSVTGEPIQEEKITVNADETVCGLCKRGSRERALRPALASREEAGVPRSDRFHARLVVRKRGLEPPRGLKPH